MKTLMVAALAVAAVGANVAFAEEDDGIVSAAPAIADPVNPKQGMLAKAYQFDCHIPAKFKVLIGQQSLAKTPAVRTYADVSGEFSKAAVPQGVLANVVRWEGFLKCKLAGTYTFTFGGLGPYSLHVNGRQYIEAGAKQMSLDVPLKVGFNKVVIVSAFNRRNPGKLAVGYRPKDSMSDPRPLTPADLYYDKPVEAEW